MSPDQMIPIYSADGNSLGFRTLEAAERLVAGGHVKPAYGRKGRLKAIFLPLEDGGCPVEVQARPGTRYSFLQELNGGRCWTLRRLDGRDEDGKLVSTRGAFLQVLVEDIATRSASRSRRSGNRSDPIIKGRKVL